MAFLPRRGAGHNAMSEINVTPLVDVMLVLLVVFIVTAPLLTQSLIVNLPKTASTRTPVELQDLPLAINRDGEIFLQQRPVPLADLEDGLRAAQVPGTEPNLMIQADENVPFGVVARVMALAKRAGIERLAVVSLPQ